MQTADWKIHTADRKMQTVDRKMQTVDRKIQTADLKMHWNCWLVDQNMLFNPLFIVKCGASA